MPRRYKPSKKQKDAQGRKKVAYEHALGELSAAEGVEVQERGSGLLRVWYTVPTEPLVAFYYPGTGRWWPEGRRNDGGVVEHVSDFLDVFAPGAIRRQEQGPPSRELFRRQNARHRAEAERVRAAREAADDGDEAFTESAGETQASKSEVSSGAIVENDIEAKAAGGPSETPEAAHVPEGAEEISVEQGSDEEGRRDATGVTDNFTVEVLEELRALDLLRADGASSWRLHLIRKTESGKEKIDDDAIVCLAEICEWYRPKPWDRSATRFNGHLPDLRNEDFADLLGKGSKTAQRVLGRLEDEHGVIRRYEQKHGPPRPGSTGGTTRWIELDAERLIEITYPVRIVPSTGKVVPDKDAEGLSGPPKRKDREGDGWVGDDAGQRGGNLGADAGRGDRLDLPFDGSGTESPNTSIAQGRTVTAASSTVPAEEPMHRIEQLRRDVAAVVADGGNDAYAEVSRQGQLLKVILVDRLEWERVEYRRRWVRTDTDESQLLRDLSEANGNALRELELGRLQTREREVVRYVWEVAHGVPSTEISDVVYDQFRRKTGPFDPARELVEGAAYTCGRLFESVSSPEEARERVHEAIKAIGRGDREGLRRLAPATRLPESATVAGALVEVFCDGLDVRALARYLRLLVGAKRSAKSLNSYVNTVWKLAREALVGDNAWRCRRSLILAEAFAETARDEEPTLGRFHDRVTAAGLDPKARFHEGRGSMWSTAYWLAFKADPRGVPQPEKKSRPWVEGDGYRQRAGDASKEVDGVEYRAPSSSGFRPPEGRESPSEGHDRTEGEE